MISDSPIKKIKDDKLHREDFVNSLSKAIINYPKNVESIVIGLIGNWGSGKSTIINFLENDLEYKIPILRFNPWNYSSQNKLFLSFFDELLIVLENSYGVDNKLRILISKYKTRIMSSVIDIASSYVPSIKSSANLINDNQEDTLNDIKIRLTESLASKGKILVIIDDIDRLNPNEVKQIFQLVKSLANFPNIIYLLAFDKNYVNFALKEWNIGSEDYSHSEDFIDKIVQVPIVVPKIDDEDLKNIFISKIDEILENHAINFDFDKYKIYSLIKPFLRNIRDLNRFFNTLDFNLGSTSDINYYDFILLIALQIFEKDIYDEIKLNKDLITGDFEDYEKTKILQSNNLKNLNDYMQILLNKVKIDQNAVKLILSDLFPKINFVCFDSNIEQKWIDEKMRKASIFSPEYFDSYFTFYIRETTLSLSRIETIIQSTKNKEEFKSHLISLRDSGLILKLFDFLKYHIIDFSKENVKRVLEVIFNDFEELFKKDNEDISDSVCALITEFILDFSKLYENKGEFKEILKTVLLESEDSYFKIFLIHDLNLCNYFNKNDTQDLNNRALNYIEHLLDEDIKSIDNLKEVLDFWNFFTDDNQEINQYIHSLTDDDLIYLINNFSYSRGEFLYFDIFKLNKLFDIDYIYSKFLNFKNEKSIIYSENEVLINSFLEDYAAFI